MGTGRTAIVILGASGDLAKRKLVPALIHLCHSGKIDQSTVIVGEGRSDFSDAEFRNSFKTPEPLASMLFYHKGITGLKSFLADKGDFPRSIVFFALPPQVYSATARELVQEGFGPDTSIIIEKPFGADYQTAVALNRQLSDCFDEQRIYRNDHYLAKEAVQNILVFRFANSIFYPVWNNNYIESIQINASETLGVGTRSAYFDKAGILRDMVQNHLMQLLCLMTMEAPVSLGAEDIAEKKVELLRALSIEACDRRQYEGYVKEPGVAPGSSTETYVELIFRINNFRWAGVPVYLRCGKALDRNGTEIGVRFKPVPGIVFDKQGPLPPNEIAQVDKNEYEFLLPRFL
jgi:glucose-6-phosphate 1-dehydrogenase